MLVCAIVALIMAVGISACAEPLVYDWDVLKDLPRKELRTAVADINAAHFDMTDVEMVAAVEADPVLIFEGKPYHGRTTHFAGIDIPNVLSQRQHIGKWTWGEYALTLLEAGAAYGAYAVYDKNKGSSSKDKTSITPATIGASSGSRRVFVENFTGSVEIEIKDHESGSGDVRLRAITPE
jgi:hypothetical protein